MKAFTLSIFLIFASNASSFALNQPSSIQLKALQAQITAIQALQSNLESLTQSIDHESGRIDPNHTQIAAWEQQLKILKAQQPPLCQKLLDDTRIAYGIRPNRYSGKIVLPGGFNGTFANYRPQFGEMIQTRVKTNRGGRSIAMGYPDPYAALTWENGDIIVTIDAFKFSPGYLAAVITHETIHYDQITTAGRGNRMSRQAREREAYNTMRGLTNRPIFQLSTAELQVIEKNYKRAMENTAPSQSSPLLSDSGFYSVDLTQNHDGEDLLLRTMREAKEFAAKQRERAEQERQRDHDARLRITLVDLARRSCADPGSVTQAELSALPDPYQEDFQKDTAFKNGLDNCGEMVYLQVSKRMSAEKLRQISTPNVPVPAELAPPPPQPAPLAPPTPTFRPDTRIPFWQTFGLMKDLAVSACGSTGRVAVDKYLAKPYSFYSFTPDFDDHEAAKVSARLGECPRRLFYKMIETIRAGQGAGITEQWVRDRAAEYSGSQDTPSFDYSPSPTGCIPGDNSRRNCIACGNTHCG